MVRVWRTILAALMLGSAAQAYPPDPEWWDRAAPTPPMDFRAVSTTLPFYGGIPLYEDMWKPHEANDHNTSNHFHNKAYWSERYAHLGSLKFNALVLYHPHPYPLFVDYGDTYPEAAWLNAQELREKQAMLRWHIAEAGRNGIKLYFLTWNIWTPRGFAERHGISQHSVDTPLVREYTRWTIAEFFKSFPGLGGLATMAGEAPVGCVDYLRSAVAPALEEITPRPRLVLFTWCAYPDEAKAVLGDYDGPSQALHYMQYEKFFYDRADPRIGMYSRDMGGQDMVALAMAYVPFLYFGNPEMVHDVVADLYANNQGRGALVQGGEYWGSWFAELAYARYLNYPDEPYDDARWERVLAERYGSKTLAPPLLALIKAASLLMPTQMKLTHSQSDHFHPQVGLSLGHMLEIPTISTYVFENSQELDERGYLKGHLGLSHPNPDWGEEVLEIGQWVRSLIPDAAAREQETASWISERRPRGFNPRPIEGVERTPLDVVTQLEGYAQAAQTALAQVAPLLPEATANEEELRKTIERTGVNLAFADYYAKKDRAAIAFEKYRVLGGEDNRKTAIAQLDASVDAWRTYAARMDAFNGGPVGHWRFWSSWPGPYTQNDFWYGYVNMTSTFAEMTPLWERELLLVKESLEGSGTPEPPTVDDLRRMEPGGTPVARIRFEADEPQVYALELVGGVKAGITSDPSLVLEGASSLLADSRESDSEWNQFLVTTPADVRLEPNTRYQVSMRYRVIERGEFRAPFAAFFRDASHDMASDRGENRTWGQRNGVVSRRVLRGTTGDFGQYRLVFTLRGKAAVVLDDIVVEALE